MTIILLILSFLILLIAKVPVFIAMVFPSIIYILINDLQFNIIAYQFFGALNDFSLIAIPLFIFMGTLLGDFNLTERTVKLIEVALRYKKGYSLKMNATLSLLLSGMSGSSIADIGALGKLQVDAAEKEGISRPFASAFSISTATVGPIFPPSIPLIIYAATSSSSSIRALIAGVLPAILIILFLYFYGMYKVRKDNPQVLSLVNLPIKDDDGEGEKREKFWPLFWSTLPIILLVPFVILTMLFGIFSPSEVGAAAVAYIIILSFMYRKFSVKVLLKSIRKSLISTSVIMILMAGGSLFARVLISEGLPTHLSNFLLNISENPLIILLAINVILLFVGMFMEGLTIIILVTPLILPVTTLAGIDPTHLGLVMVFNVLIGMLTPPFGLSLFAIIEVAKVKYKELLRELVPLYVVLLICLAILTIFPQISLWLPGMMFD